MVKHNHSSEQVAPEFALELRFGLAAQIHSHIADRHSLGLIQFLHAINQRTTLNRHAPAVVGYLRVRFQRVYGHFHLQLNNVSGRPLPANWQIFPRFRPRHRLAVHRHLCAIRPSGNSQVKRKIRRFGGRNCDFDSAVPGIVRLLPHLQANAVFQPPIELGIVVKMEIDSICAGAVEISWEGSKRTLQIRRTTSRVVPWIANFLSRGRIKRQRIAIAIQSAIKRHSGIDTVIERPFDYVRELCITRGREHAPVPHHVSDSRATFAVGTIVWQFVSVSKGLTIGPRPDSAGYIHLGAGHVIPECVQRLPISWIAGFHVVISRTTACIHRPNRMPFKFGSGGKWSSTEHVDGSALRQVQSLVSLQDVAG